jgi:hypothetical protein
VSAARRSARRLAAGTLLLLAGCGGDLQTPGEALRIFGESLPQAFVGERYSEPVRAVGGLRPFTFELGEGDLPPGLELVNGVITGVPRETGRYEFTVTVSDANLSRTFREYALTVVERPPPTLLLIAPETEVRGPTEVRLRLENASETRAASAVVRWDDELFELVEGSVATGGRGIALLWRSEPGRLQVDLAALGEAWNGSAGLLAFRLTPSRPAVPDLELEAVMLGDAGGRHLQVRPGTAAGGAGAGEEGAEEGGAGEEGADQNGAEENGANENGGAETESPGETPDGETAPEPEGEQ